ncbi:MAG: hypothetical protein VXZ77_03585 [Pseudomonadota bacterium]|nr:hypothetical protein [Pseudomonadota bacterium]
MITFCLDQPRDISLAFALSRFLDGKIKILLICFQCESEIAYNKRKYLERNIPYAQAFEIYRLAKQQNLDLELVFSKKKYKALVSSSALHLSRGRDLISFGELSNNAIILSGNRTYMNRIVECFQRKVLAPSTTKVQLHGKAWVEDGRVASFNLDATQTNEMVEKLPLVFCDLIASLYPKAIRDIDANSYSGIGSVLTSFRMAEPSFSVFVDSKSFLERYLVDLARMKGLGLKLILRRRLGKHDLATYKSSGSPEIKCVDKVLPFVDREVSVDTGPTDNLYKLLEQCPTIHAGDVTGLISVEGLAFKKVLVMPSIDELAKNPQINPVLKDLCDEQLILGDVAQIPMVLKNRDYWENLSNVKGKWHLETDISKTLGLALA